jgi:hypothetical protein
MPVSYGGRWLVKAKASHKLRLHSTVALTNPRLVYGIAADNRHRQLKNLKLRNPQQSKHNHRHNPRQSNQKLWSPPVERSSDAL